MIEGPDKGSFAVFMPLLMYFLSTLFSFFQESPTVLKRKSFKMGPLARHSDRVIKDYHASAETALL